MCLRLAHEALVTGGHLFVDNNDYKDDWGRGPYGQERIVFEGKGADGTHGRWSAVSLSFDKAEGIYCARRILAAWLPDGSERRLELLTRKHPVRAAEVRGWMERCGFEVLELFGDRKGNPYTTESRRAIFWARRRGRRAS